MLSNLLDPLGDASSTEEYVQINIDVANKFQDNLPGIAATEFARQLEAALTKAGFLKATSEG